MYGCRQYNAKQSPVSVPVRIQVHQGIEVTFFQVQLHFAPAN